MRKYKTSPGRIIFLIFAYALMIGIFIICLAPLWHVLMSSFSDPTALTVSKKLVLWPLERFDVTAYKIIAQYERIWKGYLNTILYMVLQCAFTGITTVIAGFIFSRRRFRFRNAFMMILSFTMLFNGGMIPTYMIIRKLGMLDTVAAMVIPGALGVFNILIMRTSMQSISEDLEDAARMDGAGDFTIMFKVILPLCKATFAVIMLFTAVGKWNDFMSALLYLPSRTDLYPLQMTLRTILFNISTATQDMTASSTELLNSTTLYQKSIEAAVIIVSTVPILCVYPFAQKYFVKGMTLGAVKS